MIVLHDIDFCCFVQMAKYDPMQAPVTGHKQWGNGKRAGQ